MSMIIFALLWALPLLFLLWLVEKYPPYDPQQEMQKMKREMEDELEAYKRP